MCNFWWLSDLLTTKLQEFQKIPKIHFKTILDLCCVRFWEPLDEHRPGFKSETCSKKMIKLDNFSKIEIFKFGSDFQVKIRKKSNKNKKNFRCRSACRCRSRLGLVKNYFDSKKRWLETTIWKFIFFDFFNFWRKMCMSGANYSSYKFILSGAKHSPSTFLFWWPSAHFDDST